MDCSAISHDLYNTVDRIYSDFGNYLYHYACTNAQILIDKFQNAIQVCFKDFFSFVLKVFFSFLLKIFDQRSTALEEFARYASYLTPHKAELSSNQQTIEYFTSLFEVRFLF